MKLENTAGYRSLYHDAGNLRDMSSSSHICDKLNRPSNASWGNETP